MILTTCLLCWLFYRPEDYIITEPTQQDEEKKVSGYPVSGRGGGRIVEEGGGGAELSGGGGRRWSELSGGGGGILFKHGLMLKWNNYKPDFHI